MNPDEIERLSRAGAIVRRSDGSEVVLVSLQRQGTMGPAPRAERRNLLRSAFEQVATALSPTGTQIDLDSISVSAQTANAEIPVDRFEVALDRLKRLPVRVDVRENVQLGESTSR